MILHIIPDEKFTYDYIKRIEKLFDFSAHCFWVHSCKSNNDEKYLEYCHRSNVIFTRGEENDSAFVRKLVSDSNKIIFHSLFMSGRNMQWLYKSIKDTKQTVFWVIWGGDLYNAYKEAHTIHLLHNPRLLLREYYRVKMIKRFDYVITGTDYEELKKCYKTHAIPLDGIYSYDIVEAKEQVPHTLINVMVGHSATDTCRHIESFKALGRFKDQIHVWCPLSYPKNEDYINLVIKNGTQYFGDHFTPLTNFVPYEEYVNFLNNMDIGVFNNNRQQGHGNILNLLLLGKKVYLSKDNSLGLKYSRPDYYVFNFERIDESFLTPLNANEKKNNRDKILHLLSDSYFHDVWEIVFEA